MPGKRKRTADSASTKPRGKDKKPKAPTVSYSAEQRILTVGDGDFTFSRGLIHHLGGKGARLTATSFDSESTVLSKYSTAADALKEIKSAGARALHGVDATNLAQHFSADALFDRIIFNFPHSGQQRVHINRALLRDFFASAREQLTDGGEVHVTLKTKPPYSNWQIEQRATESGMLCKDILPFPHREFPGYEHQTTDPQARVFEPQFSRTYVFVHSPNFKRMSAAERKAQAAKLSGADSKDEAEDEDMVDPEDLFDEHGNFVGDKKRAKSSENSNSSSSSSSSSSASSSSGSSSANASSANGKVEKKKKESSTPSTDASAAIAASFSAIDADDEDAGEEGDEFSDPEQELAAIEQALNFDNDGGSSSNDHLGFWATIVEPGESFITAAPPGCVLRVTQAAVDPKKATKSGDFVTLSVARGDSSSDEKGAQPTLVCKLSAKTLSARVEIGVDDSHEIRFVTQGNLPLHLTGYVRPLSYM